MWNLLMVEEALSSIPDEQSLTLMIHNILDNLTVEVETTETHEVEEEEERGQDLHPKMMIMKY